MTNSLLPSGFYAPSSASTSNPLSSLPPPPPPPPSNSGILSPWEQQQQQQHRPPALYCFSESMHRAQSSFSYQTPAHYSHSNTIPPQQSTWHGPLHQSRAPPPPRQNDVPRQSRPRHTQSHRHQPTNHKKRRRVEDTTVSFPFQPPPPSSSSQLPPIPPPFYCHTCQLAVDSPQALHSHLASHVTCQSCSFAAAPKVVKAHFQSTHGTFGTSGFRTITVAVPGCPAQRFRICVGNRPEDVRAWIAERKKRFPRRANVAQQPAVAAQPVASGGLSSLLAGYDSSSSSEDGELVSEVPPVELQRNEETNSEQLVGSNGAATVANVSLLDETNCRNQGAVVETVKNDSVKNNTGNDAINYKTRPCHFFARTGRCRNGDACRYSHDRAEPTAKIAQPVVKKPPSLLQRLLMKDREREQSLALQLLNYIHQSDYLRVKSV